MAVERIDTLVIGAGQAGIAASEHLGRQGVPHLVLERGRIAERWRSDRWDSLVTNGPAWHDRFPGMTFPGTGPDGFVGKEAVADYFAAYAGMIGAPLRTGVEVTRVARLTARPGFRVETSAGAIEALNVVSATGPFQTPVIPPVLDGALPCRQIHSSAYRNPGALPPGEVLVVGAGSSGVQIADELNRAGRRVWLSVGPHERPPRRYRGRDFVWWLGVLGLWDLDTPAPGTDHVTIAVSGARGGETVDFRRLAAEGITLTGRTTGGAGGCLRFAPDLADTIAAGDASYLRLLDAADAHVAANGLDLPPEPEARRLPPAPAAMSEPPLTLDLAAQGIGTVIWATGYGVDYGWLQAGSFDARGRPVHQRGVSPEPGLYFLGLPWLSRRGSSFIWGVWHDARHVADHIVTRARYRDYDAAAGQSGPAKAAE